MANLEEDINKNFCEDVRDFTEATELYGALCNMRWDHEDLDEPESMSWRYAGGVIADMRNELFKDSISDPEGNACAYCDKTMEDHIEKEVPHPPEAMKVIKKIDPETENFSVTHYYCDTTEDKEYVRDNSGREDYLDFYCCGTEGHVPEWVETKMNSLGYIKSPWPARDQ